MSDPKPSAMTQARKEAAKGEFANKMAEAAWIVERAREIESAPTPRLVPDRPSDGLKRCPFCNSPAEFVSANDEDGRFAAVECIRCGAGSRKHYFCGEDARDHVKAAWNKRTDAAPAGCPCAEALDELIELAYEDGSIQNDERSQSVTNARAKVMDMFAALAGAAPVAWQYRVKWSLSSGWSDWADCSADFAQRNSELKTHQFRPLFTHAPAKAREDVEALAAKWDRIADEHGPRQFTGNDHRLFANELRAALATVAEGE